MATVLRISRGGSLIINMQGLTFQQASALRDLIHSRKSGAGNEPVPLSSFPAFSSTASGLSLNGTADQFHQLARSLGSHSGLLENFSVKIHSLLDNYLRSDYKISCGGKVLDLGLRTHIMGILNVTPDSFSDGGRYVDTERALAHAREMTAAGADIIDIGGESTRPGAQPLSEDEELRRIVPVIERLSAELVVPISVDTYKSGVAKKALDAGASIVNDISGLRFSPDMARIASDYGAAVVVMHIKGTPRDMQQNPVYDDVIGEIMAYLETGIEIAAKGGVDPENILLDPGIGFGKTLEHNLAILNRLDEFRGLGRPIVLGTSRKKFIGSVLDVPVPEQRIDGTAATVALGIERGASVVRVHDVARMVQVARMTDAIVRANSKHEFRISK